jgi:hypothetical protein
LAKAKINRYNVYDNGKLIMENATRKEIVDALGCTTINIIAYADKKLKYQKRYTFEVAGSEEKEESDFEREWNKTVRLFKNVIWVKDGGRKLCVAKR